MRSLRLATIVALPVVLVCATAPSARAGDPRLAARPFLEVDTGQTPRDVLDFDALGLYLLVGSESDGQRVRLMVPASGEPLTVDHLEVTGASDFHVDPVLLPSLAPGQSTTFAAYFRGTEADTIKTATVGVFVSGLEGPVATVTLKATGLRTVCYFGDQKGCAMAPGRSSSGSAVLLLAAVLLARRRRKPAA